MKVVPSKATEPFGPKSCIYEVEIPHAFGCPLECKRVNDQVCSAHGICGYDQTNKKSRCFCDEGFAGEACETTASSGPSVGTVVGLLVIVFIICLALLGGLYYLTKQLKSYKSDTDNYMRLNAGGDSLDPEI